MNSRGSGIFDALVERALEGGQVGHMRSVIQKELLHHDILYALDRAGLLNGLVFQGEHPCDCAMALRDIARVWILSRAGISTRRIWLD